MRVLIVGSGGREHALAFKVASSPRCTKLFATRPNAGMAQLCEALDVASDNVSGLVEAAQVLRIDLVLIGPEAPLTLGLVDALTKVGIRAFGPSQDAARLEGSKAYAKEMMTRAGVPTAAYEVFDDLNAARAWVREFGRPVAVKADGLAGGKGVFLCQNTEEADEAIDVLMTKGRFGQAGARVVIEELLEGEEASFIAICDGKTVLPLASSQDHKRLSDGDTGPNTGGMGAYSPAPVVTNALSEEIMDKVMRPTVAAMRAAGSPFVGFLYAGIMVTKEGPKVLEFNVRLGDPETQPLMMRLRSDLLEIVAATLEGRLESLTLSWDQRPSLCVVLTASGYPTEVRKGDPIEGLSDSDLGDNVAIFHAGTRLQDGQVITAGGRVLGVTALGSDLAAARRRAYEAADQVRWNGQHRRSDIGWRALDRT